MNATEEMREANRLRVRKWKCERTDEMRLKQNSDERKRRDSLPVEVKAKQLELRRHRYAAKHLKAQAAPELILGRLLSLFFFLTIY